MCLFFLARGNARILHRPQLANPAKQEHFTPVHQLRWNLAATKKPPDGGFFVQQDNLRSSLNNGLGRAGLALVVFPVNLDLVTVLGGLGAEPE